MTQSVDGFKPSMPTGYEFLCSVSKDTDHIHGTTRYCFTLWTSKDNIILDAIKITKEQYESLVIAGVEEE